MSAPLSVVALAAVPLVVVLGLTSSSCTHPDDTAVAAGPTVSQPEAAPSATPLYPPIQKDAGDGHVHEYY
jgi:hypothetical protein